MRTPTSNPLTSDDGDETDRALVERAVDGSRDALRLLVERHQPFVYNVALKMFGRHEDAQELTQEVFVKVITSIKTFRHDSALRTWLYRVTVNHFLKTKRRAKELLVDDFETSFDSVAGIPDEEPAGLAGALLRRGADVGGRRTSSIAFGFHAPLKSQPTLAFAAWRALVEQFRTAANA